MLSFWLSSQLLYTAGSKPTVGDEGKLSHYSCRVITIVVELSAVTVCIFYFFSKVTHKYDRLKWTFFLTFGYVRWCKYELFEMTKIWNVKYLELQTFSELAVVVTSNLLSDTEPNLFTNVVE